MITYKQSHLEKYESVKASSSGNDGSKLTRVRDNGLA